MVPVCAKTTRLIRYVDPFYDFYNVLLQQSSKIADWSVAARSVSRPSVNCITDSLSGPGCQNQGKGCSRNYKVDKKWNFYFTLIALPQYSRTRKWILDVLGVHRHPLSCTAESFSARQQPLCWFGVGQRVWSISMNAHSQFAKIMRFVAIWAILGTCESHRCSHYSYLSHKKLQIKFGMKIRKWTYN